MRFLKILAQKVIAGNLLFFFFANTVLGSVPSTGLLIPERLRELSAGLNPLELPAGMVTVVRQSDSGTAPIIIHIQDAHANEEAQLRIREVLKELTQHHHIRLIGLEGLAGNLRPESFRVFPEKEANAAVARQLVKEGELTGAEFFAIENEDAGVEWLGLEDKNVYRRDLELFQNVLAKWASAEPDFRNAEKTLRQAKTTIFSKPLLSFDEKAGAFQKRETGLLQYARLLKRKSARILEKDLSDSKNQREFPNFVRVMLLSRAEQRFKTRAPQIKQEREKLAVLLKKARHKDRDFAVSVLARLDGSKWPLELAPRYFFEVLHGLCRKAGINLQDFPAFREYAEFFILQSEMDAGGLFREIGLIENEIYAKLIRTGGEKKLFDLHKRLGLAEKFLQLEVSREEYDKLKSRQNDFMPSRIFSEINQFNKTAAAAGPNSPDALFAEADGFYRLAGEREQFFIDRLLDAMRTKKLKQAVLISGGFHSAGIQHLLDQKGIASVTLAPRISGEGDPSVYHRVILNGKTWLDEQIETSAAASQSKIVAALETQDSLTYGFLNPRDADRPYRALAGAMLQAGLSVILRLRGQDTSAVSFQPESLLAGGTVQIKPTSSDFQISAELPAPQGFVAARGKLSKTAPYAPMGAFTVTSVELAQAASLGAETLGYDAVAMLVREYGLLKLEAHSYVYQEGDIRYWTERQLSEKELRVEFQTRQTIRRLAQETGYVVAGPDGVSTSGDLSWWAEQLRDGNKTEAGIEQEFRDLAKTQQQAVGQVQAQRQRQNTIADKSRVRALAEEYGLFEANPYAWTFEEGDISWYAEQGKTEQELRADFGAKRTVREMALQTRYKVANAQGHITSGALSGWADLLLSGKLNEIQLEGKFAVRASLLGREIRRVLIVDDYRDNVPILVETVQTLIPGAETVDTAHDGEEAWQKFQAQAYDLVLTDLQMPLLDGAGLAAKINPPDRKATVPVVLATTRLPENETLLDGLVESGQIFVALEKPYGFRELAQVFEKIQGLPEGQSLGWDERETSPTSRRVSDAIHLYFFGKDEETVKAARGVLIKALRKHDLGASFNFDTGLTSVGNEHRRDNALMEARRYFRNLRRDLFPSSSAENPQFTFQVLRERMYAGMGVGPSAPSKTIELIESTPEKRQMVNVAGLIPQQPRVYSKELFTRELFHDQIESAPVIVLQTDDGKTFLLDGHHRAVTALRAGETQIEAHIIKTKGLKDDHIPGDYELPFWRALSSYRMPDSREDLEHAEMVDSLEHLILKLPSATGEGFEFFQVKDLPRRGYIPPHHGASLGTQREDELGSYEGWKIEDLAREILDEVKALDRDGKDWKAIHQAFFESLYRGNISKIVDPVFNRGISPAMTRTDFISQADDYLGKGKADKKSSLVSKGIIKGFASKKQASQLAGKLSKAMAGRYAGDILYQPKRALLLMAALVLRSAAGQKAEKDVQSVPALQPAFEGNAAFQEALAKLTARLRERNKAGQYLFYPQSEIGGAAENYAALGERAGFDLMSVAAFSQAGLASNVRPSVEGIQFLVTSSVKAVEVIQGENGNPPALLVHFARPVEDPLTGAAYAAVNSDGSKTPALTAVILKNTLPAVFSASDLTGTVETGIEPLNALAFSETAPLGEKMSKIRLLADLAGKDLLLMRSRYHAGSDEESASRISSVLGRTAEERDAIREYFRRGYTTGSAKTNPEPAITDKTLAAEKEAAAGEFSKRLALAEVFAKFGKPELAGVPHAAPRADVADREPLVSLHQNEFLKPLVELLLTRTADDSDWLISMQDAGTYAKELARVVPALLSALPKIQELAGTLDAQTGGAFRTSVLQAILAAIHASKSFKRGATDLNAVRQALADMTSAALVTAPAQELPDLAQARLNFWQVLKDGAIQEARTNFEILRTLISAAQSKDIKVRLASKETLEEDAAKLLASIRPEQIAVYEEALKVRQQLDQGEMQAAVQAAAALKLRLQEPDLALAADFDALVKQRFQQFAQETLGRILEENLTDEVEGRFEAALERIRAVKPLLKGASEQLAKLGEEEARLLAEKRKADEKAMPSYRKRAQEIQRTFASDLQKDKHKKEVVDAVAAGTPIPQKAYDKAMAHLKALSERGQLTGGLPYQLKLLIESMPVEALPSIAEAQSLGTSAFSEKLLEIGHMFKDNPGAAQALNDLVALARQSEIAESGKELAPQVKPGDLLLALKPIKDAAQQLVPPVFRLHQIKPGSYAVHSIFRDRDAYEIPAAQFKNRVTRNEIKKLNEPPSGDPIAEAVAQSLGGADTLKGFDLLAESSQKAVELYEAIPLMSRGTGDFNLLQFVVLQALHKVVQFARKLADEKHTDWLESDFTAQDFKSLLTQTVDLIPEQVLHENEEATIPVVYRGPHNTQIMVAGQSFAPVYYLIRYRDDQVTEMGIEARELFSSGEKYVLAPGAYPLRWIAMEPGKGGQAKLRPLFDGEEVLHLRELLKPVLTMPETDRQSIKDLRLIAEYLDLLYDENGIKKYSSEAQSLGDSEFDGKLLELGRMFKAAPEAAAELTALIASAQQSEIEVSGRDLAPEVKPGDILLALRTIKDAKQQAVPPVFRLYQITADSYIGRSVFRDRDVYEIPAAVFKNRVTRNEIRILTAQSLGTEEPVQPAGLPLKKGDYLKIDGKDVAQIRSTRVLEGGKQVIEVFVGSRVGLSLKMLLDLLSIPRRSVIGVWLEPATGTKKPTGPPKQNDVLPAGKVMTLAVDLNQYRDVMDTLARAINVRMIPLIQKELGDPDITAANLAQRVHIEIQPSVKKKDTFYFHFTHVNQKDQFLEGVGKRTEAIDASRGSWFVLVEELIWDLMAAGTPETVKDVLENADFAAHISALSAAAQTVQASSLGLDSQDKYFFEIDGIRRGSSLVATVAIRYLDVFRKIAEAKGSPDEPYVDADETDRLFMINSPDGKSVYFGISDQKVSPVLIQNVTFAARPILAEAPGGNVADIAIEPEYPLVTEWDKTTKSVSAVYIPASPEKNEYLKLEILERLPQRPSAPYDASQDIFQEDTRGGKLIRVLQTHLALNHIVLRASIVQGDELRFAMEKAGELPIKGQSLGEIFQGKLRAAEVLKKQGRSLADVTGAIEVFAGRVIGPWEKPEAEQFLLGIYAPDKTVAPGSGAQSALKTDLIEYGAERRSSGGPDVYTEAYNGAGKFAILAATSRDISVEAVERQLILNPLARVAVAAIQDPDFETRLKQRLGGLMARVDLRAVQTEEEAAVFFNTLLKGPYLEKMRDFYRADLNQRDLARHIVFLAGESVLAGLDASLASRLLVPDAREIGSMNREAVKIYHNSLGYLLAREGGDFDELSRQIPDVRNALNPSGLEFRLNLTGLAERVSELYAEFQGFMQISAAA